MKKKSEKLVKAETLNLIVVTRDILAELNNSKPKLGERRIDLASVIAKFKLSTFGEYKA